jgi:hypothetical protein
MGLIMNTVFCQKWLRSLIQVFVVVSLVSVALSGCSSSSDSGKKSNDDASSDASLSELSLDSVELDQAFQAELTTYTASVDSTQDTITLTAVASDNNATIQVNGAELDSESTSITIALEEGSNTIEIVVTAEDGSTTSTYTLTVNSGDGATEDSDASLSELTLTGATLDQLFQSDQMSYTASVNYLQASVTLTPVATDDGASILVNGAEVASGSASEPIVLDEGESIVSIEVTAEDGLTTQNYSITLSRESVASFAQQAYLKASNAEENDQFSYDAVAISGDTLVVGAGYEASSASGEEEDNSASVAGAVYVFTRSDGIWSQEAYLKASNAEMDDFFGTSVAISGDTLVVGAIGEDSSASGGEEDNSAENAGAAYVFSRSDGVWSQEAYLKASNAEEADRFGWSVSISGDTLVVGARYEDSSASGGEGDNSAGAAGAAYVFSRSEGVWSQQAYLKASNAEADDYFGTGVAISGDTLVVGANNEDSNASDGEEDNSASAAGAVYVFSRSEGVWSQEAYLKASNADAGDRFGWSIAISGDTLVVGSHYEAGNASGGEVDNSSPSAGAVYVFSRIEGVWSQEAYLKASNSEEYDYFGRSVAISGDTLVVGAYREDSSATGGADDNSVEDAGAAYVFTRSGGTWSQEVYLKASNADVEDRFGTSVAISGDTLVVGAYGEDSSASGGEEDNSAVNAGAAYIWQ